jgi:hypothetical protein
MSDPAIPLPSPSLTRNQAILIASRLFAAYLLFWVVADLIYIPRELLALARELLGPSALGFSTFSALKADYYARTYMLYLLENILRIALWLLAAGWFYRCGPRIQAFFAVDDQKDQ